MASAAACQAGAGAGLAGRAHRNAGPQRRPLPICLAARAASNGAGLFSLPPDTPPSRKPPRFPLRWFRDWFEPLPRAGLPTITPPQPVPPKAVTPPPPIKKPAPAPTPAPLPIANPTTQTSDQKPPPKSPDEVVEAIREVNTAVVALTQLESTSNHPAKDLIARVARRSLRDVGQLPQRFQRSRRR